MEVTGINLALLDMPPQHTEAFNQWYDLDHLPEHVSKPDVVMARRYVATRQVRDAPGRVTSEVMPAHAPYATVYFFGGPMDFTGEEAAAGWRDKDRTIIKDGRFFRPGGLVYGGWWRLADARARPSIPVSSAAVPYLPHTGMIVFVGRAASVGGVDAALQWWERVQQPALHDVPGVLATLRFDPVSSDDQDLVLHVVLCSEAVETVMSDLDQVRGRQALTGRYPAHGGVYELCACLPYQWIVPFQYDFDMDDDHEAPAPRPAAHAD